MVQQLQLLQRKKKEPYKLHELEETETTYNKGTVMYETGLRRIKLNGIRQRINFDITNLGEHQIILERR